MRTQARQRPVRVFISYRRPDRGQAQRLQAASRSVSGLEFYSFPYDQAKSGTDWRETCRELIRHADAIVCLVGPGTADSPHVAWELDEASKRGLPIILAGPGAQALACRRGNGRIEAVEDAALPRLLESLQLTSDAR
jgi:TIR domain